MLNRLTLCAISAFLLTASCSALAGVADSHAARSQPCKSCHTAEPPSADNVTEASCQSCHGEEPTGKPVDIMGKKVPNIHKSHFDTFECLLCHKGHKPSTLACAECHQGTKIQVP